MNASILSGGASSNQNYRGLLNLMAILLLVTNSRLIAANLRYGDVRRIVSQTRNGGVICLSASGQEVVYDGGGIFFFFRTRSAV